MQSDCSLNDRILQDLISAAMLFRAVDRSVDLPPETRLLLHSAMDVLDTDMELLRYASLAGSQPTPRQRRAA